MSSDTWAIVAATGLGPIFAVLITFWRESTNSLRIRRLGTFRTLMATRRFGISPEHASALNLVEVDFHGCKKVQSQWQSYKDHLFGTGPVNDEWNEKKERLLAGMLFEMAASLGLNVPAMEIFKGGYAPKGWVHRDGLQVEALEFISELSKNTKSLPIWLRGVASPLPNEPPDEQSGPKAPSRLD